MMYELYIEDQLVDIDERIGVQLNFGIDDVANFGSRETAFSKTIVLPGTKRNHTAFGYIYDDAVSNPHSAGDSNIGRNYNVAKIARAELRLNGMLMIKGSFRVLSIIKDGDFVEYEGALFGELGGFAAAIGNGLLQDLDFSAYDHPYTVSGITNSWDTVSGYGYYYPLIDYGTYSTGKVDYDYKTFRPALFVKEYIDKIFQGAGYTYNSTFFESDLFKKLIVPYNRKFLEKISSRILTATRSAGAYSITTGAVNNLEFTTAIGGNFTIAGSNSTFTWNSADKVNGVLKLNINAEYTSSDDFTVSITVNSNPIIVQQFLAGTNQAMLLNFNIENQIQQNDVIAVTVTRSTVTANIDFDFVSASFTIDTEPGVVQPVTLTDSFEINYIIPKGIRQLDFFSWILKMFNLYVDESKIDDKVLIIKPYKDYYDFANILDWTDKVDRSQPITIMPMGMLNGRFIELKYKQDNDFYNESYSKKFNENYGDRIFDSGLQFAKEKQTIEVGFSGTPLVQYLGTDKVLGSIYKRNQGNEEQMDSNIRIMLAKKVTGVSTWHIRDGATSLTSGTVYGYAGHFDDPDDPAVDINFGAALETFATFSNYSSDNLFNVYWSGYIAEIIDKDSRLMKCSVKLDPIDVYNLDLAKPVLIDGQLYRINKIEDYDPVTADPVKCEFLKVITAQ